MGEGKDILKIGLIGCGNAATRHHLPALTKVPNVEVVALACNTNLRRLSRVASSFQIARCFTDYRALLEESEVEAIGVCVPVQHHFEVASAALDAGKHVLLEKPVTLSLDEADRLIGQAAGTDRKILVGYNYRWHPLVRRARDLLRRGLLGPVVLMNSVHSSGRYGNELPEWRLRRETGGGALIEKASHVYDLWRFLLGSEVEEILAVSCSTAESEDRTAVVTARTADGILLSCSLSDFTAERQEMNIIGRDRSAHIRLQCFDGLRLGSVGGYAGDPRSRIGEIAAFLRELPGGIRHVRYGGVFQASFRYQWKHFVDCIRFNKAVECTLEDGRRALQSALAAVESASSSGRPVKIAQMDF